MGWRHRPASLLPAAVSLRPTIFPDRNAERPGALSGYPVCDGSHGLRWQRWRRAGASAAAFSTRRNARQI